MDQTIIETLGGGPMAVLVGLLIMAFGALSLVVGALWRRVNQLSDKLVEASQQGSREAREMHTKTLEGMAALTAATQASNMAAQASLAALERRS